MTFDPAPRDRDGHDPRLAESPSEEDALPAASAGDGLPLTDDETPGPFFPPSFASPPAVEGGTELLLRKSSESPGPLNDRLKMGVDALSCLPAGKGEEGEGEGERVSLDLASNRRATSLAFDDVDDGFGGRPVTAVVVEVVEVPLDDFLSSVEDDDDVEDTLFFPEDVDDDFDDDADDDDEDVDNDGDESLLVLSVSDDGGVLDLTPAFLSVSVWMVVVVVVLAMLSLVLLLPVAVWSASLPNSIPGI